MTPGYRIKLYGQSTDLVICTLWTIYWNEVAQLRLSTDPTQRLTDDPITYGTISRGFGYLYAPAEIILPLDESRSEPTSRISISNVDRLLVDLVRSATDGLTALIEIIEPADPDNVQRSFGNLQIISGSYDAREIIIEMRADMLQGEPYPSRRFTSTEFALLHG